MILIIAEKPSLARNIVSEAGNMKRNDILIQYFFSIVFFINRMFKHVCYNLCR